MAKEPTVSSRTPEEIDAMEQEVREFRAAQAEQAAAAMREAGKPIKDLVDSDGFKALQAALPGLMTLASDREQFPFLEAHVVALRNGADGMVQTANALFGGVPATAPTPAA